MSKKLQLLVACLFAACGGHGGSTPTATSGGSGTSVNSIGSTGSTGSSHTSASTGASSSASSGSIGSTSSGSSGEGSNSSSSSGGTGGVPCGVGLVWQGETCVVANCAEAAIGEICALSDGGFGNCAPGASDAGALTCQSFSFGTDPSNCGRIGFQCPSGEICSQGACVDPSCTGTSCPPPCLDTDCPPGFVCGPQGLNACFLASCDAGATNETCLGGGALGFCCGGQCVTDSCSGACGVPCSDGGPAPGCGASQDNSFCPLSDGGPGFCCQGGCVDSAPPNCGACGLSCTACASDADCPSGQACAVSSGGFSLEVGNECAATTCAGATDGRACAIAGLIGSGIYGGELVATECCAGACSDVEYDSANCGGCGVICPAGTACQWGKCQSLVSCGQASPGTGCPLSATAEGICCAGACLDPTSDTSNCTGCGLTCPSGAICASGGCTFPDGGQTRPEAPSDCGGLDDGSLCAYDGTAGVNPGVCCAGTCVVAQAGSFATCAACGFDCPPCSSGCPGGTTCVSTGGDEVCLPLTCGGKGNGDNCAFGPQGASVAYMIPSAESVRSVVWGNGSSSCCSDTCVDLAQDPSNCGTCGLVCTSGVCAVASFLVAVCLPAGDDCLETCGPWAVCALGTCVDSSCNNLPFCAAEDGAVGMCCQGSTGSGPFWCSDVANDPENCGGCGVQCPSGQSCSQGICSGTSPECARRNGGFCNLDAGLGYLCCPGIGCTNTDSDAANCGTCGTICPAGANCELGSCT